jgi:1,6-anhydro-N-acetylmuramate kinase
LKEALLMAVLGVVHIQKMTANMPTVTGAKKMVVLGSLIQNSCLSY